MRLGVFATHPVQYHVPLWRRLAAASGLDLVVHYFSDHSVRGGVDAGFGVNVAWDVPLLDGYEHRFLSRGGDADRLLSMRLSAPLSLLREGRFDAVLIAGYTHAFELQLRALARRAGTRLLMRGEFTDATPDVGRGALKKLARGRFLRAFYAGVDAFACVGADARDHLLAHGVPSGKLFFSPYAADTDLLERQYAAAGRAEARRALGIADDACAVLFSGKLIARKDPLTLTAALGRLGGAGKVHLIVLGDGALAEPVRAAARAAVGERLTMPGFVNQSGLGRYLRAADVLVLPSRFETWGLVVNEAMQFGLPAVVSDGVGCRRDLVEDGRTGFVFPFGDAGALSAALARLIERPEERRAMGERARERVAGYSAARGADGVLAALESAAREPRVRG